MVRIKPDCKSVSAKTHGVANPARVLRDARVAVQTRREWGVVVAYGKF